jgi:hypothetical protein
MTDAIVWAGRDGYALGLGEFVWVPTGERLPDIVRNNSEVILDRVPPAGCRTFSRDEFDAATAPEPQPVPMRYFDPAEAAAYLGLDAAAWAVAQRAGLPVSEQARGGVGYWSQGQLDRYREDLAVLTGAREGAAWERA